MGENKKRSSMVLIFLAWLVVGVPFAWGVYHTLLNSMELFQPVQTQTHEGPK
jgi:hypothetical protein